MKNPARYLYDTVVTFCPALAWFGEGVCVTYPDGKGCYVNFIQETLGL